MTLKNYRDLEVWQKAMDLVVVCYQMTKEFPKSEIYGLAGQLRRAAISVPANIAEGRDNADIVKNFFNICISPMVLLQNWKLIFR